MLTIIPLDIILTSLLDCSNLECIYISSEHEFPLLIHVSSHTSYHYIYGYINIHFRYYDLLIIENFVNKIELKFNDQLHIITLQQHNNIPIEKQTHLIVNSLFIIYNINSIYFAFFLDQPFNQLFIQTNHILCPYIINILDDTKKDVKIPTTLYELAIVLKSLKKDSNLMWSNGFLLLIEDNIIMKNLHFG